jgi:thiol:disulfide interchange protein DsbD
MSKIPVLSSSLLLATVIWPGAAPFAAETTADHLSIELVSDAKTLVPGTTAWLGLHIRHEPSWHTYWINPGDSGLPTRIAWTLPPGFNAGEIAWPAPKRFAVDTLANFGYDGELLLPVSLAVPTDASPGTTAHIAAQAKWLVCHEECVPGKAALTIDLPIGGPAQPSAQAQTFAAARGAQPEDGVWKADARFVGERIEVRVRGADLGAGKGLDAFAEQAKIVANAKPTVSLSDGAVVLLFAKSDYFTSAPSSFDLVLTRPHARAIRVRATFASPDRVSLAEGPSHSASQDRLALDRSSRNRVPQDLASVDHALFDRDLIDRDLSDHDRSPGTADQASTDETNEVPASGISFHHVLAKP